MRYASASMTMLEHRYPGSTRSRFGSMPIASSGAVELQPVLAAGVDTGTVKLAPLSPDPWLSEEAELGIEAGFEEFMSEYGFVR